MSEISMTYLLGRKKETVIIGKKEGGKGVVCVCVGGLPFPCQPGSDTVGPRGTWDCASRAVRRL